MTEITVDLDDLEALIYAAVGVRDIEGKLAAHRQDPMMAVQTAKFTKAHDRLNRAVLHAKRSAANGSTRAGWDEPLTAQEIVTLVELADVMGMARFIYFTPDRKGVCDRLAAKGCVEMGQAVEGVVWVGAPHPEIIPDVTKFAIRLTPRGQAKLESARMELRRLPKLKAIESHADDA